MSSSTIPTTEFHPNRERPVSLEHPWGPGHPILLLLLLLAAAGDFANFYVALSLVADEHPVVTLLVVVALTAAAIGLAHGFGLHFRQRVVHRGGTSVAVLAALGASWLFLGLSAAAVRWVATPVAASVVPTFGQSAAQPDSAAVDHQVTSVLLLGLYLASGALAAWISYLDHDPVHATVRRCWRRLAWVELRHRRRVATLAGRRGEEQQHVDEQARLVAEHEAALAERAALATELKTHARHLLAVASGDPVATEWLTRGEDAGADR